MMKGVYIVHYVPNCEEDYIIYISTSRKDCLLFIKKHSYEYYHYFHHKELNRYYNRYELCIKYYRFDRWYKL